MTDDELEELIGWNSIAIQMKLKDIIKNTDTYHFLLNRKVEYLTEIKESTDKIKLANYNLKWVESLIDLFKECVNGKEAIK